MKIKFLIALLIAGTLSAAAQSQGYKDGIDYYNAGQYENARTILTRTLNDPSTDRSLAEYYLGQVALAQDNKAEAKQHFDAGVAANADNAFNYVGLGAIDLLNGNADAAKANFKTAQKLAKKNTTVLVAIARAYYNANPVTYAKEIAKYIADARKASKNTDPAIYILEGDMLFDQGEYGDAAAQYEQAITYDDSNPEGYVKFANSYFRVNPEFAISKLEELLSKQPNSALAQRELAEKYYDAYHWNKASDLYGRYIQNPNHFPEDKARYSVLLYYGKDYPRSLEVANEILAGDPKHFLMQRLRFLNEAALERNEDAAAHADAFFTGNPGAYFTSNDYVTYSNVLTALGQDSLAVVQYEKAVEVSPDNGDLLKGLSAIYASQKMYGKSANAYDRYMQTVENPSANDLYNMSGRCLNASATATDPEERVALADMGLSYLERAMARTEPMAVLMQRKGRLYVARNSNVPDDNAIKAYNDMIALLDADASNLDPTNANNQIELYKEAYRFMYLYYKNTENTDGMRMCTEKLEQLNALTNAE